MRDLLVGCCYDVLRAIGWLILRVGCRLEVRGRQHLPRQGGVVLASNHRSFLDPVVVGVACPRRLVFLARADLFAVPWLGGFMRFMQARSIDRHALETGLRDAIRCLRRGQAVIIFPEGGRQYSGQLGVAKPGVGLLAAGAKVPVVPVFVEGTREALPPGSKWLHPAKIRVAFGPQIGYPERRLSSAVYQQIAQDLTASWRRLHDTHGRDTA